MPEFTSPPTYSQDPPEYSPSPTGSPVLLPLSIESEPLIKASEASDFLVPLGSSLRCAQTERHSRYLPHIIASARCISLTKQHVNLVLAEPLVFIRPPGQGWISSGLTPESEASNTIGRDGRLSGVVHVVWTGPAKRVRGVKVEVKCRYKLLAPVRGVSDWEEGILFERTVELGSSGACEQGVWLEKGLNSFEFGVTIPGSAPTYERSFWGTTHYNATATVMGTGSFLTKEMSTSQNFYVAAFPYREDNIFQFQFVNQGVSSHFDTFSSTLSSNEFIVAAPLSASLTLLSVPADLTIYAINIYIQQYVTVRQPKSGLCETVASSKASIVQQGATGGYGAKGFAKAARERGDILMDGRAHAGELWKWFKIGRLPTSDIIRPTTLSGTESPIRFSSELAFEVVFSRDDPKVENPVVNIMTLHNKPVMIASCCCMSSHLTLPIYSEPTPEIQGKDRKSRDCLGCMCDMTWEKLEQRELNLQYRLEYTPSITRAVSKNPDLIYQACTLFSVFDYFMSIIDLEHLFSSDYIPSDKEFGADQREFSSTDVFTVDHHSLRARKKTKPMRLCYFLGISLAGLVVLIVSGFFIYLTYLVAEHFWLNLFDPHRSATASADHIVVQSYYGKRVPKFDVVASVFVRLGGELAEVKIGEYGSSAPFLNETEQFGQWKSLYSQRVFSQIDLNSTEKIHHKKVDLPIPWDILSQFYKPHTYFPQIVNTFVIVPSSPDPIFNSSKPVPSSRTRP
ncbi:hypothetical protein [Phaffia rhodozyma]|uniref:Uncharacterized protein n=1 Tax=Phaffia rhodozyma TaxID=264483 RepID=A0A0F7SML0_PHARH|nr:hypothetical protein [Phaffia rhodozyma]